MENIDVKFRKYLVDISNGMVDKDSSYQKQLTAINEQFLSYGLTNDQMAGLLAEVNGKATQYITQYANASAMEILKLEINQPLLEAEIALKEKELEIKEKDLILKDKEIALKEKDLLLKDKELKLKDKELEIMVLEISIKEQELLIKQEQLKEMYARIDLLIAQTKTEGFKADLTEQQVLVAVQDVLVRKQDVLLKQAQVSLTNQDILNKQQNVLESIAKESLIRSQCITEGKQQSMIIAQTGLVDRQTAGYGDNMLVKAAEFQGGLASFAVNSDSDSAQGAITEFNTTIKQMKSRA